MGNTKMLTLLVLVAEVYLVTSSGSSSTECSPHQSTYSVLNHFQATNQGCYHSTYPDTVFNYSTDPLTNLYHLFDWTKHTKENGAPEIVNTCGKRAAIKGFKYFGIEWYGTCFIGNSPDLTKPKVMVSDNCDNHCKWDIGGQSSITVFKVDFNYVPACTPANNEYQLSSGKKAVYNGCYHTTSAKLLLPGWTVVMKDFTSDINQADLQSGKIQDLGDIIKKCGERAVERQFPFFALTKLGECYLEDDPDWSHTEVTSPADCSSKCRYDVGGDLATVLYMVQPQ